MQYSRAQLRMGLGVMRGRYAAEQVHAYHKAFFFGLCLHMDLVMFHTTLDRITIQSDHFHAVILCLHRRMKY